MGSSGQAAPAVRRSRLILLALTAANFGNGLIDVVYAKGMKRDPPLYARWNAISRVEVDQSGTSKAS